MQLLAVTEDEGQEFTIKQHFEAHCHPDAQATPCLLQTRFLSLWLDKYIFILYDRKTFFPEGIWPFHMEIC